MRALILFMFLFLVGTEVEAFNWKKCERAWLDDVSWTGAEFLSSTTSYISSTGACAMIGQAEHDKKVFLVYNLDAIKEDAAIGEGEYLETYAELSGCDANGAKMLPKYFQKNFINIFGEDVSKEPSQVYQAMEEVIGNEPALREGCRNIMGGV